MLLEQDDDEEVEVFHVTEFEKLGVDVSQLEIASKKKREIEARRKKREEKERLKMLAEEHLAKAKGTETQGKEMSSKKNKLHKADAVMKKHKQAKKRMKAS